MAVQRSIIGLCLFLLTSCVKPYDLTQMPKYNMEAATTNYIGIAQAEVVYLTLAQVLNNLNKLGIYPDIEEVHKAVDIYIYWSSTAKIQLFHGDYEQSDLSLDKAYKGLTQFKAILVSIMEKSNI